MAVEDAKRAHTDRMIAETVRHRQTREQGYREQALKIYPWICGRCARSFDNTNLQLLEVHHKNNNHHDNPSDGSNWELLCTYCHEHEHSKLKDMEGRDDSGSNAASATHNPFAELKAQMDARKRS